MANIAHFDLLAHYHLNRPTDLNVILLLLIVLLPTITFADWEGRVVAVSDGDILTALTADRKQVKIRLVEIDAPETSENFGQKSKQSLADICFR